jgi:hypothetical protein
MSSKMHLFQGICEKISRPFMNELAYNINTFGKGTQEIKCHIKIKKRKCHLSILDMYLNFSNLFILIEPILTCIQILYTPIRLLRALRI